MPLKKIFNKKKINLSIIKSILLEKGFITGDSTIYVEKEIGIENKPYGPSCFISC